MLKKGKWTVPGYRVRLSPLIEILYILMDCVGEIRGLCAHVDGRWVLTNMHGVRRLGYESLSTARSNRRSMW
jgi:hypothetical protein